MTDLREHQLEAAAQLVFGPRKYLAHEPGLGKTRTAIAALAGYGVTRPLIVVPAIVRTHWLREFEAMGFGGEPVIKSYAEVVNGGEGMREHYLDNFGVDALVLDEAHFLKHLGSQRTLVLLGREGYARKLDVVLPMSGTPIPRNASEIWTLLASVFPDVARKYKLGSFQAFVDRFCITKRVNARGVWRDKVIANNLAVLPELKALLGEILLVKTLDDVGLDVPRIDWQVLRLDGACDIYDGNPLDAQMRSTEQFARGRIDTLADIADDPYVARMRRRLGELKVKPVIEMIRSQLEDSDEKVVIFAHHRSVLAALREGLSEFMPSYIDGDTGEHERDIEVIGFRMEPMRRVFIGQSVACSVGMDGLQYSGARRVILVEPDWTPDVNLQLAKRVARMGATNGRIIVQLTTLAGSLDEAIVAQNKRETEMVAQALS